ncbi:hypothetical protein MANES_13G083516v8 [Manihot esculenta]|uniref:Uncharacterized protein n=1 Tax=Manihot esculenta TaxID=3983 RepID=A0ACB7GKF7_MANES|nr:hypothetical protein MANES_13G083516v8 [Manihot esculenta]
MVRIAELEEQVKMLQELTEKNIKELKDFKEEVRKNSQNANEAGSSNESGSKTENRVPQSASVDNRGQLSNQKENQPIPAQDKGSLGTLPNPFYYHEMTQMLPKIELVTFEGKEPRAWLNKCVKYFEIYHITGYGTGGKEHTCEEFERGICNRFGNEGLDDIVEGFTKLRQENILNAELGESYFPSGFIGGLKDEIRLIMKHVSLAQAVEIARLHEQLLDKNRSKRSASSFKPLKPQIPAKQPK